MSAWTSEHSRIAFNMMHESEGCKFIPWFEDNVFMYAICFTCDKKLTPDEWYKMRGKS